MLLQENQAGKNSNITNEEIVAITDNIIGYECITPTQHKKIIKIFNLVYICEYIR